MKTLLLIRHAKSDWTHLGARDYDRRLNQRGCIDAPEMGRRLMKRNLVPEFFVASSAERARLTATLITQTITFPEEQLEWRKELYLASPATMLEVIGQTPAHVDVLALLAHNPGITELAESLSKQRFDNVPTAGIVTLSADIKSWDEAHCDWQLRDFDYPKRDFKS